MPTARWSIEAMSLAIADIDGANVASPREMAITIVERMGASEMWEVRRRGAGDNVVCMQESMGEGPAAALEITAVSCVEPLEPIPCCAGATIETTCKCKVGFISAATRARLIAMADSQKKKRYVGQRVLCRMPLDAERIECLQVHAPQVRTGIFQDERDAPER